MVDAYLVESSEGVARLLTPVPSLVPSLLHCHCCVMTPINAGHTAARMSAPDTAMKMFSFSHRPRQSPSATASASNGRRARAIASICLDGLGTCRLRRLMCQIAACSSRFLPLGFVLFSEEQPFQHSNAEAAAWLMNILPLLLLWVTLSI